jgi:hypothetical protein
VSEGAEYVVGDVRCPHGSQFWGRCVFDRNHVGSCVWQNGREALALLNNEQETQ